MKNANLFVLAIVLAAMTGCAVVTSAPQQQRDLSPFVRGGAMLPPRPPMKYGDASLGVPSPFSPVGRTLQIKNRVCIEGDCDAPALIGKMWVMGVNKPLINFGGQVNAWDHVRPIPWLPYDESVHVPLPPCQLIDGTPACKVKIVAQVMSWRYNMAAVQIPDANEACVTIAVPARTRYTELLWSYAMVGQITCPNDAAAVAVVGEKKTP